MTGAQFYEKLAEAGERMVWTVDEYNLIRGKFRKAKVKRRFCPVTAVCYLTTGKFFEAGSYNDAADKIRLNRDFAGNIADSADDNGSVKIRRHLKRVLNLS